MFSRERLQRSTELYFKSRVKIRILLNLAVVNKAQFVVPLRNENVFVFLELLSKFVNLK